MSVGDLGYRRHMEGVVQPALAPPREPEDFMATRGNFDQSSSVVGGEVVPAAKRLTSPA